MTLIERALDLAYRLPDKDAQIIADLIYRIGVCQKSAQLLSQALKLEENRRA